MNRSSSNQSQSRSTGHSYTNYVDSDEPEVVRICKCGHDLVVRTSWTNSNPGRHFRSCSTDAGNQCGVFEWIDPPMCRRSIEVIPGLLKRLNSQEKQLKDYGQKLRGLKASLDDIMLYRIGGIVACVIILVLLIVYIRATILCM
ncbi:hypothetical protein Salat_0614700 [Sesamum alatum]|uniref:GRF-type domain-containing protein n=1 Tax=Sesamum alatum TaxID=300844 RepID=A0AAE1YQ57_9LAMI|nr:hypothetical protein Salat_0614700 [Sesamum alatum]